MKKLTHIQQLVIEHLRQNEASTAKLLMVLAQNDVTISEDSLVRHMAQLKDQGLIESSGKGPARRHHITDKGRLLSPFSDSDLNEYLSKDREPIRYNPDWLTELTILELFENEEKSELLDLENKFRDFFTNTNNTIRDRWYQKWLIEFAWKSSAIEGNTYNVLETETLLLDRIEATGKSHAEAVMIINHQSAIRYVYDNRESFIKPDTKLTKNIHSLLVNGLGVSSTVRDRGVGISGSVYRPLASKKEIQSELERALMNINSKQNIWSKTLAMVLSISYIQPFEDGNKRTARVMANGLLYADNNIPLVFGNIDPTLYRRACIAFYELGNASIMKNILLDSWRETISELNNN